ncbi:MAG: undecaprenyl-diphosphate phosphatase, partial [Terriglobia bacterium]
RMSLVQVIVLAIVQGVTEFLPISSTAHLILTPWLFGWQDQGLTFDVALHAGTLAALLIYFFRDWWTMLGALLGGSRPAHAEGRKLVGLIALATIPGGLAGYFLESYAESAFRSPVLVAVMLMGIALVMWAADGRRTLLRKVESVGLADAVAIGLAQALALIPGTSRAGITIAAGLFRNLTRASAARFSFLLATPIIGGATLKKALEVWQQGFPAGASAADFALGLLVSGVVGYAAIAFLLRYLQVRTLKIFVAYRLALGGIILAAEFLRSTA